MIRWPERAYVPGATPRHPEGAFDDVRGSVREGMDAGALARCAALAHGLAYDAAGFHWEAHEVLEPVWLALPDGPERDAVRGLIQRANARLKMRMGRPAAALRLAGIARALMPRAGAPLGLDLRAAHAGIDAVEARARYALNCV